MSLTLRIRELRRQRGLTIAELADVVGVSTPHMSEVERGKKNLNNHLIERISAALGVSPAELISEPAQDAYEELLGILGRLDPADRERVEAFASALAHSKQAS